jgi:hypothetical protein
MGTSGSWPNFDGWLNVAWGSGAAYDVVGSWPDGSNMTFGRNPPFTLNDILAQYPNFFGAPVSVAVTGAASGSASFAVASAAGLAMGQLVTDPLAGTVPPETYVQSVVGTTITLTNQLTGSPAALSFYTAPLLPLVVLVAYTRLAWSSIMQQRWGSAWPVAMGWFVAHYATLYLKSSVAEMVTALQTVIHGEVPMGATPGAAYALTAAPPGNALQSLTKNGKFMQPNVDYTLAGNAITLAAPTLAGDQLYATWPTQQAVQTPNPGLTGAQVAAQALANGILTSKSVGDVSAGYTPLASLESWGAWNLTVFGQQLATMGKIVGAGPSVMW